MAYSSVILDDSMSVFEAARSDTATRILDVAERLFVEHGFEATSLRMITQQADVNLAAVNYHFGSKEALLQKAITRRLAPWVDACLAKIDTLEAQYPETLPVEKLVLGLSESALTFSGDTGALFVRLVSRIFIEKHNLLRETISSQHSDFIERVQAAFARALPELPEEQLAWRLHLTFNLLFNALAGNDVLKLFLKSPSLVSSRNPERIVHYLVPYLVAGLTAQ